MSLINILGGKKYDAGITNNNEKKKLYDFFSIYSYCH